MTTRRPSLNQAFSEDNEDFRACCVSVKGPRRVKGPEGIGIPPTKRQASKFRMRKGRAYLEWRRGVRAAKEAS